MLWLIINRSSIAKTSDYPCPIKCNVISWSCLVWSSKFAIWSSYLSRSTKWSWVLWLLGIFDDMRSGVKHEDRNWTLFCEEHPALECVGGRRQDLKFCHVSILNLFNVRLVICGYPHATVEATHRLSLHNPLNILNTRVAPMVLDSCGTFMIHTSYDAVKFEACGMQGVDRGRCAPTPQLSPQDMWQSDSIARRFWRDSCQG